MNTCIVAGGAGFIGSHLCRSLLEKGYRVICVDSFATGTEKNVHNLVDNSRFKIKKHDIREPLMINEPVQYVFHLASRASPVDYQKHALETLETNAFGTRLLLTFALEKNARFLFASTSEVYGDPEEHPQKESYWGNVNPIGIRSCYDEGKRFGESLVMTMHRETGLDVRIARIFNTYGPNMTAGDGRVIPNFITQALANKPLTIYGDGSQTRSLCYVGDLVVGLETLMFKDNISGEVVNLGNTSEITIKELAQIVKKIATSTAIFETKDLPEDDPTRRCPDITKAKQLLNWEPRVSLEEGLEKTVSYFRSLKEGS
ncbi:MAG: SDR family oxidoreductase [Nanoarchaeota archaeon]|nr:SDR family oxidoreductase [Nanoarchaeota archaeon]